MMRFVKILALVAAIGAAGTLISAPVAANGHGGHHGHHGHHHGHRLHHHGFPVVHGFARILGAFLPHRRHHYVPIYPRRHYVPLHPRPCHRVIRTEIHYGRLAKIGGVMCYDRYGRAYIVRGSRHAIHFYR